jgi:hypothetical protein
MSSHETQNTVYPSVICKVEARVELETVEYQVRIRRYRITTGGYIAAPRRGSGELRETRKVRSWNS